MFNPQLDFGSKVEFEGKEYIVDQKNVTIHQKGEKYDRKFLDLKIGELFTVEGDDELFIAQSNPFRDELGIPCIEVVTY